MNILVTGAAGFIGFHVAGRLLERGDTVVGLDCVNDDYSVKLKRDRIARLTDLYGSAFRFVEADVADVRFIGQAWRATLIAGGTAVRARLASEPGERVRVRIDPSRARVFAQ